jgi:hypothetical protein
MNSQSHCRPVFSFKKFYPPSFSLLASFHFLYNSDEEQQQQHNVFLFNNTDPQQLKEQQQQL